MKKQEATRPRVKIAPELTPGEARALANAAEIVLESGTRCPPLVAGADKLRYILFEHGES